MVKPFGFNVIGHVSGNLGLGVSARNIIQVLLDNDFPVAVLDVDPGLGRWKHDERFDSLTVSAPEALPYAINLLIFPPPSLVAFVPDHRSFFINTDRLNAAFIWWELPVVPPRWLPMLEFFDVLVAPSAFIRHTLDVALPRTMTIGALQPLYLPSQVSPNRDRFGLGAEDIVYVTSLELASDAMRKNVVAVIEAFARGLMRFPGARLVVKVNNYANVSAGSRALNAVREASIRDPRIRVITDPLTYEEVLSLYASSDVFVSLHRAEGLALGPMEAMALGKACIATAWSGNMEYMDHTNAGLIPYTLVPVKGATGAYSDSSLRDAKAEWAEPDIDEAAAWMRRLAEDRAFRLGMGERASQAIARLQEEAIRGKFALEIKALFEHKRYTGSSPALKTRLDAAFSAYIASKPRGARAIAKLRRAASQALDRHLMWRFRDS